MSLIECINVCVNYGNFEACLNVNFKIEKGNYVCIVGANGSGKSTLVKSILGLIPIKSGKIIKNFTRTGYLPQQNSIQRDFPASVQEVVLSGCIKSGSFFYTHADKENAMSKIKKLNLEDIAKRHFSELSGGQQQRVLLARALCAAENLLVLDEPVTGLDPVVTDELYKTMRMLNQEEGLAVIMVSHDVNRAARNASHILHMDKTPLFFGTSEDYMKTPLFQKMSAVEVCTTHNTDDHKK